MDYEGNYFGPSYQDPRQSVSNNRYESLQEDTDESEDDEYEPQHNHSTNTPISQKPRGFLGKGHNKGKRKKQGGAEEGYPGKKKK